MMYKLISSLKDRELVPLRMCKHQALNSLRNRPIYRCASLSEFVKFSIKFREIK